MIDREKKDIYKEIAKCINKWFNHQAGIIYCPTVKKCKSMEEKLKKLNINCKCYHAKLTDK